jgi:ABC-type branched-subunit amino acid transport system substrate-binding protein
VLLTALLAVLLAGAAPTAEVAETSSQTSDPTTAAEDSAEAYGRTPTELVPYGRSPDPYRRFYQEPLAFRGPGRDEPAPAGLRSVRIGLLAPIEETEDTPAGLGLLRGAQLALAEANAAGGHDGLPFELVSRNDQALWGSSANTLIDLAYRERVWALIGSIDSNSTHVALRAALKAELCIVNVGSSDPTMTETGIPWIVRITPDDRQTGYRLARLVFEELGHSRVAVLRSSDRYGRFGVKEFRDAARRLGRPLPMEILIRPGADDFDSQLERLAAAQADAVVLWTKSREAGRLVREMRRRGIDQPVFGTDRLVSQEFLETAGAAAEGVVATAWADLDRSEDARWTEFRRRYEDRYGESPNAVAAYGYDAARLVVAAIEQAGLNRARIRDELMGLRGYSGVAGTIELDATSNNVSPPLLARVKGGRFAFD